MAKKEITTEVIIKERTVSIRKVIQEHQYEPFEVAMSSTLMFSGGVKEEDVKAALLDEADFQQDCADDIFRARGIKVD